MKNNKNNRSSNSSTSSANGEESRRFPCDTIGIDTIDMLRLYASDIASKIHYRHNLKTGEWQILHTMQLMKGVTVVSSKYRYSEEDKRHMPKPTPHRRSLKRLLLACDQDWKHDVGTPLEGLEPLGAEELMTLHMLLRASRIVYILKDFPYLCE